jgi:hypothetical protein
MNEGSRYCPTCRLTNPASARKCVCGSNLISKWELSDEAREKHFARQRLLSKVWSAAATLVFCMILWAVYSFSGLL